MSRWNKFIKVLMSALTTVLLAYSFVLIFIGTLMMNDYDILPKLTAMLRESLENDAESLGIELATDKVRVSIFLGPIGSHLFWTGIYGVVVCLVCFLIWTINIFVVDRTKLVFLPMIIMNVLMAVCALQFFHGLGSTEEEYAKGYAVYAGIEDSFRRYGGMDNDNVTSVTWNAVMSALKCCGVLGYEDFQEHKLFKKWREQKKNKTSLDFVTPLICCKNKAKQKFDCALKGKANSENNWWNKGCFRELWRFAIQSSFFNLSALFVTVFNITLALVALTGLCIRPKKKKNRVGPMY